MRDVLLVALLGASGSFLQSSAQERDLALKLVDALLPALPPCRLPFCVAAAHIRYVTEIGPVRKPDSDRLRREGR
jgi:hypothetical protein